MARLIDSMKNKALHIALSRASNPVAISRHATWLREGDARFQGRQPTPSTSIQTGEDGKPERVVCAAIQMEAKLVASGIRYVEFIYRLAAKAAVAGASIVVFPEYSGLPLVGMLPGIGKMLDSAGSLAKINPPLRSKDERLALWDQVRRGNVSFIASDHAPLPFDRKSESIWESESGAPGVETMMPLIFDEGVSKGKIGIDHQEACDRCTDSPGD
jgi:hypothetical protein